MRSPDGGAGNSVVDEIRVDVCSVAGIGVGEGSTVEMGVSEIPRLRDGRGKGIVGGCLEGLPGDGH